MRKKQDKDRLTLLNVLIAFTAGILVLVFTTLITVGYFLIMNTVGGR